MAVSDSVTGIAAVARNGVIGVGGTLPWHIPADLAHFRVTTMGGALIMGRRTFESLPGPLPGRASIVLSHWAGLPVDDGETSLSWASSIEDAIGDARATGRPVFVIGGAQIFEQAWPYLTDLELTLVDGTPDGDTFFPGVRTVEWAEVHREPHEGFSFVRYRRRLAPGVVEE